MTILAGIDIGNSTTEVLLARVGEGEANPVHAARARTVGEKGSIESLMGASALLQRAEKQSGFRCEAIAIAELHPVHTLVAEFPRLTNDQAPLKLLTPSASSTPAGSGVAYGVRTSLGTLDGPPASQDVVVSVPRDVDFEDASAAIASALSRGWPIVGVLVGADEAVLIGNRIRASIPIVDEATVDPDSEGDRVALEVAEPGECVSTLNDPVALAATFDLPFSSLETVSALARRISDSRAAAVTTCSVGSRGGGCLDEGWIEFVRDDAMVRLSLAGSHHDVLRDIPPGSVRALQPPCGTELQKAIEGSEELVRDLFTSDLPGLAERVAVRRGSARMDAAPVSVYVERSTAVDSDVISDSTGRPVFVVSSESRAARLGALTTPAAPPDAAVCDIGGGTIDVIGEHGAVVAAGAGDLLTVSVAFALGLTLGVAEYAKRSPSVLVETPHMVRHEDGSRDFLAHPTEGSAVGSLCMRRRSALVPFTDALSPEEWRGLRLSIKAQVIVGNINRCLSKLDERPRTLLLCGGPAQDRELVRIVGDWIGPRGIAAGRTNVAARYGPRYAVALGLVLLLAERGSSPNVA